MTFDCRSIRDCSDCCSAFVFHFVAQCLRNFLLIDFGVLRVCFSLFFPAFLLNYKLIFIYIFHLHSRFSWREFGRDGNMLPALNARSQHAAATDCVSLALSLSLSLAHNLKFNVQQQLLKTKTLLSIC